MSGRAVRWLLSLMRPGSNGSGGGPRLTIIRHHRVYPDGLRPLYRLGVRESVLREQVMMLCGLGRGPLTVAEGLERLGSGEPRHWVAMTFDDGYADNVERALPILAAAGGRATFYLTAGLIEERRAPWWDRAAHAFEHTRQSELQVPFGGARLPESIADPRARIRVMSRILRQLRVGPAEQSARIAELRAALGVEAEAPCELATWAQAATLARAGMEIGAHTLSHPYLDRLDPAEQGREIGGSVQLIAERLGVPVAGLAYPGGAYDGHSISAARAAGLAYAVTTRAGVNGPAAPYFELNRRGFDEGMCVGPDGRFSRSLARAELEGAFDRLRGVRQEQPT